MANSSRNAQRWVSLLTVTPTSNSKTHPIPTTFFKLFSLGRGHKGLEGVYLSSKPKQTYVDLSPRGGQREQVLGNVRAMLKYTLPA